MVYGKYMQRTTWYKILFHSVQGNSVAFCIQYNGVITDVFINDFFPLFFSACCFCPVEYHLKIRVAIKIDKRVIVSRTVHHRYIFNCPSNFTGLDIIYKKTIRLSPMMLLIMWLT